MPLLVSSKRWPWASRVTYPMFWVDSYKPPSVHLPHMLPGVTTMAPLELGSSPTHPGRHSPQTALVVAVQLDFWMRLMSVQERQGLQP